LIPKRPADSAYAAAAPVAYDPESVVGMAGYTDFRARDVCTLPDVGAVCLKPDFRRPEGRKLIV
jgi:hypothetical protein